MVFRLLFERYAAGIVKGPPPVQEAVTPEQSGDRADAEKSNSRDAEKTADAARKDEAAEG